MHYQFGDTAIAAQRLKVLAEVYAASTSTFLGEAVTTPPTLVVDLGCGPGYTTHLLADTLGGERVVGLDHSAHFIALACQTATARVSFVQHDVTAVPFPAEAGDLLYARLVLAHLRNPAAVLTTWATQLRPQGLLLLEEVEWIHTNSAVFTTYLDIVVAMLAQQSTNMYAGQEVHALPAPTLLTRRSSQVRQVAVTSVHAATMFFLNMQTWKHLPFIQTHYPATLLKQLEEDLRLLAEAPRTSVDIEWGMRQLVYERHENSVRRTPSCV
jgi:SAM-dependent methyltransferase